MSSHNEKFFRNRYFFVSKYVLDHSESISTKKIFDQNFLSLPFFQPVPPLQDYDELALAVSKSKSRELIPKLCLPNEILQSSESNIWDAKINESINSNENEDKEESSEIVES